MIITFVFHNILISMLTQIRLYFDVKIATATFCCILIFQNQCLFRQLDVLIRFRVLFLYFEYENIILKTAYFVQRPENS